MTSCSAWIVETMSRIRPVRAESRAVSKSRFGNSFAGLVSQRINDEHVIVETGHLSIRGRDVAAANDALRIGRRCSIERCRGIRAPVHDEGILVRVGDTNSTDIPAHIVNEIKRPKQSRSSTESSSSDAAHAVLRARPVRYDSQGTGDRVADCAFESMCHVFADLVEALVTLVEMCLFNAELALVGLRSFTIAGHGRPDPLHAANWAIQNVGSRLSDLARPAGLGREVRSASRELRRSSPVVNATRTYVCAGSRRLPRWKVGRELCREPTRGSRHAVPRRQRTRQPQPH